MSYQLTPTDIERINRAMNQVDPDPGNWPTGEMVEAIAEAVAAGIRTEVQPDDAVFNARTMKVLGNMGERMLSTIRPMPQPEETPEQWQARSKAFDANLSEMAHSLGTVLTYLSTPNIRLWPDNGREDCISLSGSLHQMSFGIIFHANADGTGRWNFHS